MYYIQLFTNGLVAGCVYALFAVGLSMSYGIFRFINFAHGEFIAWGAYGVLLFTRPPVSLPLSWAVVPAVLLSMGLALASDRLVYRPLRHSDRVTLLIASIGLSFFLRSALILFFGSDLASYNTALKPGISLGGIYVTTVQLAMAATAVIFMAGLYLLLTRTLLGKALRATRDNLTLAGIMGLPLARVSNTVWALAGGFAAAGGILLGMDANLEPNMGLINLIKAFAAVLLGGAGNIWGAMLGGLFIGVAENLGVAFLSPGYKDFVAFAVILVMLFFKPRGLFALGRGGVR